MQPQTQSSVPFKGDAGSVANSIQDYLKTETLFYFEYLEKLKHLPFDVTYYLHWRFIENKVNSHRFFLPLVDAVIIDLYISQNLQVSTEQGFNIGLDNYISFKDSVRQSLNMLDPYLISCSYTQTVPSYQGYCQWAVFQQQQESRLAQVKKFKEEIAGLNTIVFRQDVLASYAFDPNNQGPLSVKGYQNWYNQFVSQEQNQQNTYDIYIQELRKSIEGLNLFVFNDYVDNIETVGEQPTKEGYLIYYDEVLKKYDQEYLKTKHDQTVEAERTKKQRNEKISNNKKDKAADMDEDQEDLADQLDEVQQQGYTSNEIQQGVQDAEEITQKDVEAKLQQSKLCKCCKGNVYECNGEVCQMLGNCICLSQ